MKTKIFNRKIVGAKFTSPLVGAKFTSPYVFILMIALLLSSCKNINLQSNFETTINTTNNIASNNSNQEILEIAGEDFIVCDYNLFDRSKIYMLKSHQAGQMLSIVIKNKNDELIIFDGGRIDDGKYLCEFIKSFGGRAKYWFLTHIHDDHLGAIYEIFMNYTDEIYVENLCYNFADLDWYYEKAGGDATALILFNQAKDKYLDSLRNKNLNITINDNLRKNDSFGLDDIKVKVMNNIYKLDSDSINNSSIAYKVDIEDKTMMILGDMGYEAGELFYKEYADNNDLESDIVVMAHHGQGGVDYPVYQKISPIIALWPTTEYIYENKSHKLHTDDTKKWLQDLGVKENILSYKSNYIVQ